MWVLVQVSEDLGDNVCGYCCGYFSHHTFIVTNDWTSTNTNTLHLKHVLWILFRYFLLQYIDTQYM